MKLKKKSNLNPFLFSSSSSYNNPDSVLKLLPVAIFALAFSLPSHDREVLAYLIARSILTSTNTTSKIPISYIKSKCNGKNKSVKKIPLFECGCFDCYTSFWCRWDSSPNRDLIHQVIEAFEEHLLQNEYPRKQNRGKKRGNTDKVMTGCIVESDFQVDNKPQISVAQHECEEVTAPEKSVSGGDVEENGVVCEEDEKVSEVKGNLEMEAKPSHNQKGLARKVLPDVVGLLNSFMEFLGSG